MAKVASGGKGARAPTVLVVEDDAQVRFGACAALRQMGFIIVEADSIASAVTAFKGSPDVVVTDLRLPDGDALDLLPKLRSVDPAISVFIVTGYGTIDLAVRAVKQGADDFLTKPVDMEVLGNLVRRAAERRWLRRTGRRRKIDEKIPFESQSPAMRRVEDQVEKLRDADCSVLLLGETGTGKSVLARRIHDVGARTGSPFVDINCAGLTKEFVETELFGHERGAFTGALAAKQGLLDAANGGTLFLDEIGDIDPQVQPKLLKVLEDKRFRRMGDVRERAVDVRLIGATHLDLIAAVSQKTFRADLYYRISTVSITIPSLKDRREDIVPLAEHMLSEMDDDLELTASARASLLEHTWPGNLRELRNVLERAVLLRDGGAVRGEDLRFDTPSASRMAAVPVSAANPMAPPFLEPRAAPQPPPSARTLSELEREHIQSILAEEKGRVEAAARRLGMPRSTLYQRLKEYGISSSRLRLAVRAPGSEPPDNSDP